MMMLFENSGAKFSDCGNHRMQLYRIWDPNKPLAMFIGLNPSKASQDTDDNTIKRVRLLTQNWDYGGFYMMNLFTFISTDPKKLNMLEGNLSDSDWYLKTTAEKVDKIVFAWGNFKVYGRDKIIKQMFPEAFALKINKNGSPQHPLFIKGDTQLIKF